MPSERRQGRGPGRSAGAYALRAGLVYALLGALWIVASDATLNAIAGEDAPAWAQTAKGLAFMLFSGGIVFLLVRRFGRRLERAEADVYAAQDALARTEQRFRTLVEKVPGVVYVNALDSRNDKRSRCLYVGPQILDLLGRSPEEWMADDELWSKVIHPEDRPRVLAASERAYAEGELSVEYRARHRDGSLVWIHEEALSIHEDDGRTAYWQGLMVDITPQRMADQGLHELSESLRGVFTASPLAIVVLETDGRVRHWNPAAERIFGWKASEVVGARAQYVPADRLEEFDGLRRRMLAGESIASFETVRVRKDGRRLEVSLSIAPLLDPDGRVQGGLGVLEDITERRRIANEVEFQAEMLSSVTDAVLATDAGFRITYWNRGAETLYGWTAEEAIGQEAAELLRAGPADSHDEEIRRSFLEHGLWHGDVLHRRKDGTPVMVDALAVVRHHADGARYFLSVNRDVSERHAAEEALTRRAQQQEAIDRLGLKALQGANLQSVLEEACEVVASTLGDAMAAVLELQPPGDELVLRAGAGWEDHVLEAYRVDEDTKSLAIHALAAGEPVVVDDLRSEWRFTPSPTLLENGVVGGVACVVSGGSKPYGVLQALSRRPRAFRRDDVRFLEGVAAIVGLAIDRDRAEEDRRIALENQLRLASRLELLHQIDRDVLSSMSIREMAERTLEHLRLLVPYDRASVTVLDQPSGRFTDVAVRSPEVVLEPNVESYVPDDVARELLARDVLLISDLEEFDAATPYVRVVRDLGIRSCLTIALRFDGGQVGMLALSSKAANAFDEESVDIAKEVGSELAIAIAQTGLREALAERADQLERLAEERQQMLHRIVRAQEEERERVALELHDGLGQVLTSISLFAANLEAELPAEARRGASRVNELVRRAIVDSRQLVWSLRPPELERLGLVAALRRLCEEVTDPELTVDLHEDIGDMRLPPETEAVVYRVVQEAVHNAQKHAAGSAISILLRRRDGVLTTLVEDNGRGFDPAVIAPGRGLGLVGMRERAELVSGALVVESSADAGTRVRLEVPFGVAQGTG